MINLIPNQEKKKKVKDFYFRLTVVFLFTLGFCGLLVAVAVLPSFYLSYINKNLAEKKLEAQKLEPMPLVDLGSLNLLEDLNGKLALVEKAKENKYSVSSKVINEIVLRKMPDIKINQILYARGSSGEKKVEIRGLAPSRERLLFFRRALEDDIAFKEVNLPISNFVRGSNIEFYLSLKPL